MNKKESIKLADESLRLWCCCGLLDCAVSMAWNMLIHKPDSCGVSGWRERHFLQAA